MNIEVTKKYTIKSFTKTVEAKDGKKFKVKLKEPVKDKEIKGPAKKKVYRKIKR